MSVFVYIILCLIWGSTWLAIKIGLGSAPPLYAASVRFLVAVSILIVIVKFKKLSFPKGFRNLLSLGHPGVYMYGVSYACVYFGETYINSATAAVLFGSFPFFVAILSNLALKHERISPLAWLGLVIGFLGVVLISYDSLQTSPNLFLGSMLTVVASFASAFGLIIHKKNHAKANIYVAATVQMALGGLLMLPMALIFERLSDFAITTASVGSILYLAVFGTVVAFLGYYWLLTHMKAVTVSMIAFATPLIAILVGEVLAHETLSVYIYVGTAMILGGMLLVGRK
jgi:drug/metabolite transporter (DMT)-like permease